MEDGASSSSGETIVVDHGKRMSSCGYCRSSSYSSVSHGMWADKITVDDYQGLLDRGWRRSGCFLYKPEMETTCCPSYTIRLKAGDFVPTKEQLRVHKKMLRYLEGKDNTKKVVCLKDKANSLKRCAYLDGDASSSAVPARPGKESPGVCEKMSQEDGFIDDLSKQIDEAVSAYVRSGEFPSALQLPKAVVRKVTCKAKRKLVQGPEDLLYTSNISFQIAAALKRSCLTNTNVSVAASPHIIEKGEVTEVSPSMVAESLASAVAQSVGHSGLITKACNGHLNFYSTTNQIDSDILTGEMKMSKDKAGGFNQTYISPSGEVPPKRRRLEIRMKRSSFDPEEFALYRRYQIRVHNDKPEKVTESSYKRFLVDSPLIFVPPNSNQGNVPPCGFGSFHQQYLVDGKLVAVGVVDILPKCLSSKYLFWDPDLAFLSLGKYSALQEINWVKEAEVHCPSLQYYYLGYYIHSCSKMRYKAAYHPSELLCPLRYEWVPFEDAKPLLDERPYVVLSDYKTLKCQASLRQQPNTSSCKSGSPNKDLPGNEYSDEDEEIDFDVEGSDTCEDNDSDSEASYALFTDDQIAADIGDIMMNLNASRVKFKDLQTFFGPIDKRYLRGLEMQLCGYVKAVGQELASRMVYSLG